MNKNPNQDQDQFKNLMTTVTKNKINIDMLHNRIKQLEDIIYQMLKNPDKANSIKNMQLGRLNTAKAFPIISGGYARRTRRLRRNRDSMN